MSTATVPPSVPPAATPPPRVPSLGEIVNYLRPGQRILLTDITWEDYEQLLKWRDARTQQIRITFDSGRLELVTHSNLHERFKGVLGRLVSALCEELGIPMIIGGNCTIRSADLDRGFEPDDWVYLGSTATRMTEVTATRTLDFRTDPPPDLAIEIEMIRSLLDRIPLYAGVKIPELWRFDGEKFTIWLLQENGEYTQAEQSLAFTMVTPAIVSQYLTDLAATDDAALLRRFRSWIRTLPAAANTTTT